MGSKVKQSDWDDYLDWGEYLFGRYVHTKGSSRNVAGLLVPKRIRYRSVAGRIERVNQLLQNTLKRSPEVIVKISGSGKGMGQISAHFDYISRNGKVEVENERGEVTVGNGSIVDLKDEWRYGHFGIPEHGRYRESLNIVLSMPPGTDRASVLSAARDFAISEFSNNHQYVFVAHNDEEHPHVHLCVKVLGIDGTRLNPRKIDMQRWRESFADRLRSHGIDANATPRRTRGVITKSRTQAQVHSEHRSALSKRKLASSENKHLAEIESVIDRKVIKAFEKIAQKLASSDSLPERKTALSVVSFVNRMHAICRLRETKELQTVKLKQFEKVASLKPIDIVNLSKDRSRT